MKLGAEYRSTGAIRRVDTLGRLSALFVKGDNFHDMLLNVFPQTASLKDWIEVNHVNNILPPF